jgi:hypothetical protein
MPNLAKSPRRSWSRLWRGLLLLAGQDFLQGSADGGTTIRAGWGIEHDAEGVAPLADAVDPLVHELLQAALAVKLARVLRVRRPYVVLIARLSASFAQAAVPLMPADGASHVHIKARIKQYFFKVTLNREPRGMGDGGIRLSLAPRLSGGTPDRPRATGALSWRRRPIFPRRRPRASPCANAPRPAGNHWRRCIP